jgi:hypothetical protein
MGGWSLSNEVSGRTLDFILTSHTPMPVVLFSKTLAQMAYEAISGIIALNPFHMYFIYNHMFAAEFTWGYAGEKGAIKKDTFAINMAKTMVHQMQALFQANLKYPEEFDMPLHRLVREKLSG